MENETTVMKMLIVVFIIGLLSVTAMYVGDFYYDVEMHEGIGVDTTEIPVVDANIYKFNQKMIYYGS